MKLAEQRTSQRRTRPDGRRSLLVYLREDIIKRLKVAALDEDRHAYLIAEEALTNWLDRKSQKRRS
jgi:hypothetical protein